MVYDDLEQLARHIPFRHAWPGISLARPDGNDALRLCLGDVDWNLGLEKGIYREGPTWWTVALVIQFWHHIEHALLIGQVIFQHNLFHSPVPVSILQFQEWSYISFTTLSCLSRW